MKIEELLSDDQLNILFKLGVLVNAVNLLDFTLNQQQITNDELARELDLQNKNYLEKILVNQEKFSKRLDDIEKALGISENIDKQ